MLRRTLTGLAALSAVLLAVINGKDKVALAKLRDAHEGWFPRFMRREEVPLTN